MNKQSERKTNKDKELQRNTKEEEEREQDAQ